MKIDWSKVKEGITLQDVLKEENKEQKKEIERLNKKIEQYENPEDMTLMFMWCDEKAKDEIKRLENIIKEVREYIKKYRTMVDGYEDEETGQMIYEHRLKLNKHQVRKLLEILDKGE